MDRRLRTLPLLRCFESAARQHSYSKAAQELSITQAAVSQQIRNLEEQLGTKLFKREGRAMVLTQQGRILANHVTDAFSVLSRGLDKMGEQPVSGTLTVTSSLSFSSIWLVPRLWKLSVLHPEINVRAIASVQFEDIRHSDIDVAIRQAENINTDLYQETILVDPVYPYCSPNLPRHMPMDKPSDLLQCGLVEAINPGRFSWKNWFSIAGVEVQEELVNWMEVTTWEMGLNAVMSGHGVCLATQSMAADLLERGAIVRPFDVAIEPGVKFTLIYDEDSPKAARIKVFADWLKQEMQAPLSSEWPVAEANS